MNKSRSHNVGLRGLLSLPRRLEEVNAKLDQINAKIAKSSMTSDEGNLPSQSFGATPGEVYAGYSDADMWVFDPFADLSPNPEAGFVTDWLGTRTRTTSLWGWAREYDGQTTPSPVPHDLYEAVEWVGMLKSVVRAPGPRFTMMELGAGFGPWLGAASTAARHLGLTDQFLLGVEADPGRFDMMRQHLIDNGHDPEQHRLICGAVGDKPGKARWPHIGDPADATGARPVTESSTGLDKDDNAYMGGAVETHFIEVEIHPFSGLLKEQPVWDLVHIDVQGWETKICEDAIALLNERVRWLNIGTHSRVIDGDLIRLFHDAGWVLENEKPTRFTYKPEQQSIDMMTEVDGCQVWRNPRLVPDVATATLSKNAHIDVPAPVTIAADPEPAITPQQSPDWDTGAFKAALPLRPEHTAGAKLFADRNSALDMLPKNGRIAEVGVALGDFSQSMLDTLTPTRFDAFDIFTLHNETAFWGKTSAEWLDNLTHLAFYERRFSTEIADGKMGVFEGDSSTLLSTMPDEHYDMIYIDGDHSYQGALLDAEAAARKIKKDGILVFNDYVMADFATGAPYGVVNVVNEFCVNRGWKIVYLALQPGMFCDVGLKRI